MINNDSRQFRWVQEPWIPVAAVFIGSTLLYSLNLHRPFHHDELYHILAARGILETGEPRIAEGVYERVFLYTLFLSKLISAFGESPAVLRMSSVISMAGMLSIMFIWTRKTISASAAVFSTALFATSPFAVDIALFTRFYSFQNLAFFLAAISIYHFVEGDRYRLKLLAAFILFLYCAIYLQLTSVIGAAGIAIWLLFRLTLKVRSRSAKKLTIFFLAIAICGVITLTTAVQLGLAEKVWSFARTAPLFMSGRADQHAYYLESYMKNYPVFVPIFLLLGVLAASYRLKPALFCLIIFIAGILLSSAAAAKNMRYIIYLQPFFFIVIGAGLAIIATPVTAIFSDAHKQFTIRCKPLSETAAKRTYLVMLICSIVLVAVLTPAFARTAILLADLKPSTDWDSSTLEIQKAIKGSDIVVTLSELDMLYRFGHYDVLFSPSRMAENPGNDEFDPDFRTGRAVVSKEQSMVKILTCFRTGVFVTPRARWVNRIYMPDGVSKTIKDLATPLNLPNESNLIVYTWNTGKDIKINNCAHVRRLLSRSAAP